MGLLDKFKEIITENDDDFDDYYDDDNRDYGLAAPERAERQERPRHERAPKPERQERPRSRGRDDKVVNIHTTTQLQVVLFLLTVTVFAFLKFDDVLYWI